MFLHQHHDVNMCFPPKQALKLDSWPFEASLEARLTVVWWKSRGLVGPHWTAASEVNDDKRIIILPSLWLWWLLSDEGRILWQWKRGSC